MTNSHASFSAAPALQAAMDTTNTALGQFFKIGFVILWYGYFPTRENLDQWGKILKKYNMCMNASPCSTSCLTVAKYNLQASKTSIATTSKQLVVEGLKGIIATNKT